MKNQKTSLTGQKQKSRTLLYIVVCFIIVIGSAKFMTMALETFEQTHKVEAETLPELPIKIDQNQTTKILEDGYLIDKLFLLN